MRDFRVGDRVRWTERQGIDNLFGELGVVAHIEDDFQQRRIWVLNDNPETRSKVQDLAPGVPDGCWYSLEPSTSLQLIDLPASLATTDVEDWLTTP
jgi:hypothetical protein